MPFVKGTSTSTATQPHVRDDRETPLLSGRDGETSKDDLPDEAGQELGIFAISCTILFMTNHTFKAGESRDVAVLLPPRIEDYVDADNPVRAIESFVCALDLAKLGFRHAGRSSEAVGQPPYDPADLLKLYLYGYINQVRSSRRLEREASRNLELIWLLKNLKPGYRTIANFRKENWAALKAVNRRFMLLIRSLGLFGGSVVAIDGSFFHGDASKASIFTRKRLAEQIAKLDQEIEAYGESLEDNDAAEAKEPGKARLDGSGDGTGADIGAKVAALMARRSRAEGDLARLEANGETQLSLTDPDARLLVKSGQGTAGYNVQVAVDDKHNLIVASEVVNDSSDVGQLHAMAKAAKDALEAEQLQVLADQGYYSSLELKACEDDGIVAYVPVPESGGQAEKNGRFSLKDFSYDPADNAYHCPAGELLRPMEGRWKNASGRTEIRYASATKACRACLLKTNCLSPKASRRTIGRWEHEDVLDRHRARMQGSGELMRRRGAIVEHPFGTLKCRAGYRHFLVRGLDKVRGEWSLMALCYNFTRVLNILRFDAFIAAVAKAFSSRKRRPAALLDFLQSALRRFWMQIDLQLSARPI